MALRFCSLENQLIDFLLLIVCVLFFSVADYFAAKWGYARDTKSLFLVMLIGPFAYLLFGYLAATTSLSKMVSYVCVGIIFCSIISGYFLLGERPNRLTWIALGIIVVGLVLLAIGKVERGEA
jgi:drug/metabolite transporter (DMT)-like permease